MKKPKLYLPDHLAKPNQVKLYKPDGTFYIKTFITQRDKEPCIPPVKNPNSDQ